MEEGGTGRTVGTLKWVSCFEYLKGDTQPTPRPSQSTSVLRYVRNFPYGAAPDGLRLSPDPGRTPECRVNQSRKRLGKDRGSSVVCLGKLPGPDPDPGLTPVVNGGSVTTLWGWG